MSDDLLVDTTQTTTATAVAAPQTIDKLIGIDSLINSTTSNLTTLSSVTDVRTGAEKFTDRSSLNSSSSSSTSSIANDAQLISLGSNTNQNGKNKNNSLDDDDLDDDYEQMQTNNNSQNLFENRSLSNDNEFLLNNDDDGNGHEQHENLKISKDSSSEDMIKELFDFYDVEKSGYIQVDKFLEITKENMADQWEFNQKVNDPIQIFFSISILFSSNSYSFRFIYEETDRARKQTGPLWYRSNRLRTIQVRHQTVNCPKRRHLARSSLATTVGQ